MTSEVVDAVGFRESELCQRFFETLPAVFLLAGFAGLLGLAEGFALATVLVAGLALTLSCALATGLAGALGAGFAAAGFVVGFAAAFAGAGCGVDFLCAGSGLAAGFAGA